MFNVIDKITLDELSEELRLLILAGSSGVEDINTTLDAHLKNTIIHITAEERTSWNNKAPLDSPYFLGTPRALTPDVSDTSEKLATTKFVNDKLSAWEILYSETTGKLKKPVNISLTGNATSEVVSTDFSEPVEINVTEVNTNALIGVIKAQNLSGDYNINISGTSSFAESTNRFGGHTIDEIALLNSPIFKGIPKVPTALNDDNSKQIANTEFVNTKLASVVAGEVAAAGRLSTPVDVFIGGVVSGQSVEPFDGSKALTINITSVENTLIAGDRDKLDNLKQVALTGSYTDLTNTPSIPSNVSDLTNDLNFITNETIIPTTNISGLHTVATSGDYNDLESTPYIPTKVSDLENDLNFVTSGVGGKVEAADKDSLGNNISETYISTIEATDGGLTYSTGSGTQTEVVLGVASTTINGLLSKEDKSKLDSIDVDQIVAQDEFDDILTTVLLKTEAEEKYSKLGHTHTVSELTDGNTLLTTANAELTYSKLDHNHQVSNLEGYDALVTKEDANTNYAPTIHNHVVADLTDNDTLLRAQTAEETYSPLTHNHDIESLTGYNLVLTVENAASTYAPISHSHNVEDLENYGNLLTIESAIDTFAELEHTHTVAQITDSNTLLTIVNAEATYAKISHDHDISTLTGYENILTKAEATTGYAPVAHTHTTAEISDLAILLTKEEAEAAYAVLLHTHTSENITDLDTKLETYLTENRYVQTDESGGLISETAKKWATPIKLSISGAVTATAVDVDGSANVDLVAATVNAETLTGTISADNLTGDYNINITGNANHAISADSAAEATHATNADTATNAETASVATSITNTEWTLTVEDSNLVIKHNNIIIYTFKSNGELEAGTFIEK